MRPRIRRPRRDAAQDSDQLISVIRDAALPLASPDDLDPLLERIGDARCVLLGEATHGTSEFYTWRAAISERLIRERGFSFIAVEGDWPDCYRVNRYVKARPHCDGSANEVLHAFERWPTWMWANREVERLITWLRAHDDALPEDARIGFYGLDVYSLWDSLGEVVRYLETVDPEAARSASRAYECFEPYHEDAQEYARATAYVPAHCADEVVAMLQAVRGQARQYEESGRDAYFNAEQNALVTRNAERYYRTMVRGGPASWNIRDTHMVETLERLLAHHGPTSKAIVWEHNTHVGDARFTDMARGGMINVGQLVRQRHEAEGVVIVGFGTHRGAVIAGEGWGEPMCRMRVPDARAGSTEDLLHRALGGDGLLLFADGDEERAAASRALDETRGHRAIGVVYDPDVEHWGNYVPTNLASRYDAFVFIDETHAVDPIHMPVLVDGEPPETYPSGI